MNTLWTRWAAVWAAGLTVFGLILAGAAHPATDGLTRAVYALVGPNHALSFEPTLRFSIALMGAVSIGWGATILLLALDKETSRSAAVWRCVTCGFAVWFVIDSALSIYTGFALNALSNLLLVLAGALPLWKLGWDHAPSTSTAISTAGSVP